MRVAKIDVDVKMGAELLQKFIETRVKMLEWLGYRVLKVRWRETERGYHFWFTVERRDSFPISDRELWEIQFLLGDDINRVNYNLIRLQVGKFNDFNALFSEKRKCERKGSVIKRILKRLILYIP